MPRKSRGEQLLGLRKYLAGARIACVPKGDDMVEGSRETLVAFEMTEPKFIDLHSGSHTPPSAYRAILHEADRLSFDLGVLYPPRKVVEVAFSGPKTSGVATRLSPAWGPVYEAIVYGTDPEEVTVTSDMLDNLELEEGRYEVAAYGAGRLVVCEARFMSDIPDSSGRIAAYFTTQDGFV